MHPPSVGPVKTYAACASGMADTGSLRKLSLPPSLTADTEIRYVVPQTLADTFETTDGHGCTRIL